MTIDSINVSFDVPESGLSVPAHLVFVSPGQINAQVPWELAGQTSALVKVRIGESFGGVVSVNLADVAPALFENPLDLGTVAAVDPANIPSPILTPQNAAKRGSVISLYANGLGPVANQPDSREPSSTTVLARTLKTPAITIGGVAAEVSFGGLTPGLPGLYQLNVTVPANIGAGNQPVVLAIDGVTAKTLTLPIK